MQENNNSPIRKYNKYWDVVEEALNEGTEYGYKIAIIETEKILSMALNDKGFFGKNISEQAESAETVLKKPERLNYARSMFRKIINEPNFGISREDAKEIILGYYQAISDITRSDSSRISLKQKIDTISKKYISGLSDKMKKLLIYFFVFFLLVFISAETSIGQSTYSAIVNFSKFLFYKIIPGILTTAVVATLVIGLLYYWQSRNK